MLRFWPGVLLALSSACGGQQRPLILESYPSDQAVGESGWTLSGGARDLYVVRRDTQGGRAGWLLEPVRDTYGKYGTWMRSIDATEYRAKRVRITATIRTQGATRRVDFWSRAQAIDSPGDGHGLGYDSTDLPVDSDWRTETLVMDVPAETAYLQYGVGVAGPGKLWLESSKLEVVGQDVPLTHEPRAPTAKAVGESGWVLSGGARDLYVVRRDTQAAHSAWLLEPAGKYGTWMRSIDAADYRSKRIRITVTTKTEGATRRVDFWARAQAPDSGSDGPGLGGDSKRLASDSDWTTSEIVMDVPSETAFLQYGVGVAGPGRLWLESAKVEIVAQDVPLTHHRSK